MDGPPLALTVVPSPPLPAATGAHGEDRVPGPRREGKGGRSPTPTLPGTPLPRPPPQPLVPFYCNARAAAAEPARASVAPVTATPPGAALRAAVHIPSPGPLPRRGPAGATPPRSEERQRQRRLVAASPRSPDTPARRQGLGLQREGGWLARLMGGGPEGRDYNVVQSNLWPPPRVLNTAPPDPQHLPSSVCPFNSLVP